MPPTPGDIRAQFLLQLRTETDGFADKIGQEFGRVKDQIAGFTSALATGQIKAEEYAEKMLELGPKFNFFGKIAGDVEKFAQQEADDFAKLAARHEQVMAKMEADAAREAAAEAEGMARLAQRHADVMERMERDAEQAAQAEADAFAKLATDHEKWLEKMEADELKAAMARGAAAEKAAAAVAAANAKLNATLARDRAQEEAEMEAAEQRHFREMSKVFDANGKLIADYGDKASQGAGASSKFGMGVLNVAHAFQDLQFGIGAVLNNIPLVVMAMGGSAGMAGGVMLAAVALDTLGRKLKDTVAEMLNMTDPAARAVAAVDLLSEGLKRLEAKPLKFGVDYSDIENARKQLDRLKAEDAAYQELVKKRTSTQQKVARGVEEAIVEYGGGTDEESSAENLTKLIEEAQRRAGTFGQGKETVASRAKIDQLRKDLARQRSIADSPTSDPEAASMAAHQAEQTVAEIKHAEAEFDQVARTAIRNMIGRAKIGIDSAIVELGKTIDRAPDVFATGAGKGQGVDPVFRTALEQARAANVRAVEAEEQQERLDEERRKGDKARRDIAREVVQREERRKQEAARPNPGQAAADALRNQNISRDITTFGADKSLGGELEGDIKGLVAKGSKARDAAESLMGKALDRLGKAGVAADVVDEVARGILNKARDKALADLIVGGGDIQAAARAELAAGEAKADRPEIRQHAARVGQAIKGDLTDAVLRRASQGQGDDAIRAGLAGQVGRAAAGAGVPADLADDVAAKILGDVVARVRADIVGHQGGAGGLLRERQAAGVGRARAADRRGEQVQVEQLAGQVFNAAPAMMGTPITADVARDIARRSVEMQRHGADANAATLQAMREGLAAMEQMAQRLNFQQMQAQQMAHMFQRLRIDRRPFPMRTIPNGR